MQVLCIMVYLIIVIIQLIEAYTDSIKDIKKKTAFISSLDSNWMITSKFKVFNDHIIKEKILKDEAKTKYDLYINALFGFIKINRNKSGHPTGLSMTEKELSAFLQIFSEASRYTYNLIDSLK